MKKKCREKSQYVIESKIYIYIQHTTFFTQNVEKRALKQHFQFLEIKGFGIYVHQIHSLLYKLNVCFLPLCGKQGERKLWSGGISM